MWKLFTSDQQNMWLRKTVWRQTNSKLTTSVNQICINQAWFLFVKLIFISVVVLTSFCTLQRTPLFQSALPGTPVTQDTINLKLYPPSCIGLYNSHFNNDYLLLDNTRWHDFVNNCSIFFSRVFLGINIYFSNMLRQKKSGTKWIWLLKKLTRKVLDVATSVEICTTWFDQMKPRKKNLSKTNLMFYHFTIAVEKRSWRTSRLL